MKTQTLINIGFFAEVMAFIFAGFFMAKGSVLLSFIILTLGFIEAFLVGDLIKKKALP